VLLLGAAALIVWGVGLLIFGIPTNVRFSWSLGFFTATVTYAAFVFTRYTITARLRSAPAIYYLPLLACIVAAVVDVGVGIRLAQAFAG